MKYSLLLQIIMIALWYTVPAFTAVPAVVIFIPTLCYLFITAIVLLIFAIAVAVEANR